MARLPFQDFLDLQNQELRNASNIPTIATDPNAPIANQIAVWMDGDTLTSEQAELLLRDHDVAIYSDLPLNTSDIQDDTEYNVYIITRSLSSSGSPIDLLAQNLNRWYINGFGPSAISRTVGEVGITPNSVNRYGLSFNGSNAQNLRDASQLTLAYVALDDNDPDINNRGDLLNKWLIPPGSAGGMAVAGLPSGTTFPDSPMPGDGFVLLSERMSESFTGDGSTTLFQVSHGSNPNTRTRPANVVVRDSNNVVLTDYTAQVNAGFWSVLFDQAPGSGFAFTVEIDTGANDPGIYFRNAGNSVWQSTQGAPGADGMDGAAGPQARFTISIYRRSSTAITSAPVGGTYDVDNGTLTGLATGWTEAIPTGSDTLYESRATINPAVDTGTVNIATRWSIPFEAGASGGGSGGHVIENAEGTDLVQRANLQFTGNAVTVVDGGATDDRTIVSINERYQGQWVANTPYLVGDIVFLLNVLDDAPRTFWIALNDVGGTTLPSNDATNWRRIDVGDTTYTEGPGIDIQADNTITVNLADDSGLEFVNNRGLRVTAAGEPHIPLWSATTTYNIGDIVAYRLAAGAITTGVPATTVTNLYIYTGVVSGDGSTSEEPFISTNTGVNRSSRDWARPAGIASFFNSGASYAEGALVEFNNELYRARRDVIRPLGANQPDPAENGDWTQITSQRAAVEAVTTDGTTTPAFGAGIDRIEWDRFNRIIMGHPTNPDGTINIDGDPVLINTTAAEVRTLIEALSSSDVDTWAQTANPSTQIPDAKIPASIARDSELFRTNRGEVATGQINMFYSNNTGTTADWNVQLGDLGRPPVYTFQTIATRNSGDLANGDDIADYDGRTVFAVVLDTVGDGSTPLQRSTWILRDPPASGRVTLSTAWEELTDPATEVTQVDGCIWNETTNSYDTISLGTTAASGGGTTFTQPYVNSVMQDTATGVVTFSGGNSYNQQTIQTITDAEQAAITNSVRTTANQGLATTAQEFARENISAAGQDDLVNVGNDLRRFIADASLENLPHASTFTYVADTLGLTGNINRNSGRDWYNSLGLFLEFNDPAMSVPEGTTLYLFGDGDGSSGEPVLTIRRNEQTESDITGGRVMAFDVINGFEWLEQFLAPPPTFGSTRDLTIPTQSGTTGFAAFGSFYTRQVLTEASWIRRDTDGTFRLVHAQTTVGATGSDDAIVTEQAVREGLTETLAMTTSGYPEVGGIAIENLGSRVHPEGDGSSTSWPEGTSAVFGQPGYTYEAPASADSVGDFNNASGSLTTLPAGFVVEVDINFTVLPTDGTINDLRVRMFPGAGGTEIAGDTQSISSTGVHTFRLTRGNSSYAWVENESIRMSVGGSTEGFTYHINAVRFSFSSEPFTRIGAGGGGGTGDGSVTSITAGDGLNGGTITTSGTISVDNTVARTNQATNFTTAPTIGGSAIATVGGNIGAATATTPTAFSNGGRVANVEFTERLIDLTVSAAMPSITANLVADRRYAIQFSPTLNSTQTHTVNRSDIMINGAPPSGLWLAPTGGTNQTSVTVGVPGNDNDNNFIFYISFDSNQLATVQGNTSIETFTVRIDHGQFTDDITRGVILTGDESPEQVHGNANEITLVSPDGTQSAIIRITNDGRLTFSTGATGSTLTRASMGSDGTRSIDFINDPTPGS